MPVASDRAEALPDGRRIGPGRLTGATRRIGSFYDVTAPSEAEDTCRAYLAMTPMV